MLVFTSLLSIAAIPQPEPVPSRPIQNMCCQKQQYSSWETLGKMCHAIHVLSHGLFWMLSIPYRTDTCHRAPEALVTGTQTPAACSFSNDSYFSVDAMEQTCWFWIFTTNPVQGEARVWIDEIGLSNESKAHNQIGAGFLWALCPWCNININVDWINYICYKHQRLSNYTFWILKGTGACHIPYGGK